MHIFLIFMELMTCLDFKKADVYICYKVFPFVSSYNQQDCNKILSYYNTYVRLVNNQSHTKFDVINTYQNLKSLYIVTHDVILDTNQ